MESLALLPADLTAFASPLARPAASQQAAPDVAGPAPPGGDAFAQLFALLAPPLASGQELPLGGKPLPLPLPDEASTELPTAAESTTDGGAAASPVLPPWLALRTEPAVALTAALPLDTPTVAAGTVRDDAGFAPRLAAASPLAAALRSAPAGPTAEIHFGGPPVPIETAGPPTVDAAATTPGTTGTEALESATLDEILGRESPFASPRAQAESRSLAPTPATSPATVPPAAQWLAPAGEAALQAAARAADSTTSAARPMRRGDGLGVAAPVASLTEPSPATPATDWLPPPVASGTGTAHGTPGTAPTTFAQGPVDTGAPEWQEAFAGRIQWLVDQRIGEARIKLNPPELGAVDVKISLVDDKTFVQLTAATAAARDELAQSLPRLRDLFAASGLELGGASVQGGGGRGAQPGAQGGGYEPAPRYSPDLPASSAPEASETRRAERGVARGVDVFA